MPFKVSGDQGVIRQIEERFETDRFGVDTVTLKEEIGDSYFPESVRGNGSPHPRFPSAALVKRSASRTKPGFWEVVYTYEGLIGESPEPTYELRGSLDQEPIETHPNFITAIAGKPSAPQNGAVFIDPANGRPTTDDTKGVFREFASTLNGELNPKGGVESYLVPGAEWVMHEITVTKPEELRSLGTIDAPTGGSPSLNSRDWLLFSQTYQKRGHVYQVSTTWKLSGKRGWDVDIYE